MRLSKYIKLLLLLTFCSFIIYLPVFSQDNRVLLATATIKNSIFLSKDTIQFDLYLQRNSDLWKKFANATFEIIFQDTTKQIKYDNIGAYYLNNSSQINTTAITGSKPSKEEYHIVPMIRGGRMLITITGPESFNNCAAIPYAKVNEPIYSTNSLRIGRFYIYSKVGDTLSFLRWNEPLLEVQAIAFKIEHDSLLDANGYDVVDSLNNDMDDTSKTHVLYNVEPYIPKDSVDNLFAYYIGNKQIDLHWTLVSKDYNQGFIVERGIFPFDRPDTNLVEPPIIIADYKTNKELQIDPWVYTDKPYEFIDSTIPYMGVKYRYFLIYRKGSKSNYDTLKADVTIPRIVLWQLKAMPNPFTSKTTVYYWLEEDCMMDCIVWDVNGRRVETLFENQYVKRNIEPRQTNTGKLENEKIPYTVEFNASPYAQQGLYYIEFIGKPINKPNAEVSKAIIKVEYIK
jgi:hypothetical protein